MPSYSLGVASKEAFDFELPSGNTCRMKHVDLPALIAAGVIDSFDSLTAMVQTDHVDRVKKGKKTRHLPQPPAAGGGELEEFLGGLGPQAKQVLEIMKDKKKWAALEKVVNAVVVQCVLEPKVVPDSSVPGPAEFNVSNVSITDRFAIFAEAMQTTMAGQEAVKPFRGGRQEDVADMDAGEDVRHAPERNAGGD